MATENDAKKDRDQAYDEAIRYWGGLLKEMNFDMKFALGDQWSEMDKNFLHKQRREALSFNKTHRILKIISGFQRKNRLALKYDAVEGSDIVTARQLGMVSNSIMNHNDGYNIMSDAFEKGGLMVGANLVGLHVDYTEDMVNGDIMLTRWPYNSFLIDPNFSKHDLSDAGYILTRQYVGKNALMGMVPASKRSMLAELHPNGKDNKFPYLSTVQNLEGKYNYRYDEFWVQDYTTHKILINPLTNDKTLWTGDEGRLKVLLANLPGIKVIERQKRTVKLMVFVEDKLIYEGNPWGLDSYPYVPVFGFFTPEAEKAELRIQGVTRLVRDPQEEVNKRKSKMLDIIDSVIASGYKAKANSVVDPNSLYVSGQGKVIWVKDGYELTDVQEINPGKIPEGLFRLSDIFDKDIVEIPGANEDLLGTPEGSDINTAGILSKMRQSSGITILQDLFDNYRRSKKLLGMKILQMIQGNYNAEKVKRIINEQPTPEFYNKEFAKYDCVPTEGILTDTQRAAHFSQLMAFKQMGAPIPWSTIIESAPLEGADKLMQIVKAAEEAQSKQAQEMAQMNEYFNQLNAAKAESELADATDKRAEAVLERARAIKELNEIDLSKIKELLEIVATIEERRSSMTKR